MNRNHDQLAAFLAEWPETSRRCRSAFVELSEFLASLANTTLEFLPRPGVSYSLRAEHRDRTVRPLYTMVDVIDSEPRWLSVCFYGRQVTDPGARGDYVPGGLLGEDGICFDVEDDGSELLAYLKERITEAHRAGG